MNMEYETLQLDFTSCVKRGESHKCSCKMRDWHIARRKLAVKASIATTVIVKT